MEFKNQNEQRAAVSNTFLEEFKHQSHCDVSLVIAGRMMKAHKRILSTFSTFFKQIFEELEAKSSMACNLGANVAFLNYKYEHVDVLIKYMYTGVIRVSKDEWPSVLKCATDLGITTIVDYGKQQESNSTTHDSNAEKRKLEDRRKEIKTNAVETKRAKTEPPKEPAGVPSDAKKTETKSNGKERNTTAEDILSGVSFDHSTRRKEKPSASTPSNTGTNTQITKVSKPMRISEPFTQSNSKTNTMMSNETPKKDTISSLSHKLLPTAASTPKINNSDNSSDAKSSKPQTDDSDDSMDYSPFTKSKDFANKLKDFQSTLTSMSMSKSGKKESSNKEQSRSDKSEASRKEEATKPRASNELKIITCGKCGKTYTNGNHLKESELPTPPALCPMQGCEKMMKMNRMLKDHLTKFHKVSLCEEK